MLADASISWAEVSKAKAHAARPVIGHTHTGRRLQRGPASGGVDSGRPAYRLQEATTKEESRGPPPRRDQGRGGAAEAASREGRRVEEDRRVGDGDARR
jgi:hypothetical protein